MGTIQFEGSGPFTLSQPTGVTVQHQGTEVMLSLRLWRNDSTWTLVRVPLTKAAGQALYDRLGLALAMGANTVDDRDQQSSGPERDPAERMD